MRVYTLTELFGMTRAQLFALHDGVVADLNALPEGAPDRASAIATLRNIRCALGRLRLVPE